MIDDQQDQIIIAVVVEGETGQYLRSKCHFSFPSIQRESKTAGPAQGSTSGVQVWVP
jgi:hypothetical protein